MAEDNTAKKILKEEIKQRIPEKHKKGAEAAEELYDNVVDIRSKTKKRTGNVMDASAIPEYVDAGMKAAEKGDLQGYVNKFVLYLDNPENEKTAKVMNTIREYWSKLPGIMQAKIVHDLSANDPIHTFLRVLVKTGLLPYSREKAPDDTVTIGKGTAKVLIFLFQIIKPFINELKGVDTKVVAAIMSGVGFAENVAYNAKVELIKSRNKRTKKTGGTVTPITAAKRKPSGKPNPKRVRRAA